MSSPEDTLVLLLAGGVGSRLNVLVKTRAKPSVPFAGLYRIIDFSLSNVMNSGMKKVGVLTQYKPLSLMRHLATGEPWDLTGRSRGVKILPPSTGFMDSDWYKGTADAIRQNLSFIKANPSEEILVLSGDHIYQMDLYAMIEFHRQKNADITVGMMIVPESLIHQFGTGITNDEGRIIEWEEKPKVPRTNLASMGIYVFNTEYLLKLLAEDKEMVDFGIHLIPKAIARDNVFAYPFDGYWRDVGTIQAYWEANMDLLKDDSEISPETWGIRPNPESEQLFADRIPARFAAGSKVSRSMISAGCVIEGEVVNSVLSPGVKVGPGCRVTDSIILHDCVIEEGATVDLAVMDKQVTVGKGAVIGTGDNKNVPNSKYPGHLYTGISLVGKEAEIPPGTTIGRNCIINPWCKQEDFKTKVL
ncbi:MAG: glucose-1-phosphate adenylyltransferase family protein, partial [Desulfobacterales bacterium]|nr:glucose-1-phosphate adenylyltransferase family protein [Desulfobacterales bacterium]